MHRETALKKLIGISEAKRPLWWPKCSWNDNIKMDVGEMGCDMVWIQPALDRVKWEHGNVSSWSI